MAGFSQQRRRGTVNLPGDRINPTLVQDVASWVVSHDCPEMAMFQLIAEVAREIAFVNEAARQALSSRSIRSANIY